MADNDQIPPELVEVINKAKVVDELMGNPATRKMFLGAVKTARPNLRIAELDIPAETNEAVVKPLKDEIKVLRDELAAERGERLSARRAALMESYGLDPKTDTAEVQKFADERKIGDYDSAMELYSVVRRASAPSHFDKTSPLTLPNQDGLFNDPTQWSRRTAHDVINEIVAAKRGR